MPIRSRITFLFAFLAFVILSLVCGGIYYFTYQSRINVVKTRLANRAITTARLLSQREFFDENMVERIDSSTTIAFRKKAIQAYDYQNKLIYDYKSDPNDSFHVNEKVLDETRVKGRVYFVSGDKEAVAYHYTDHDTRIVVVASGIDEEGKQNLRSLLQILLLSFWVGNIFILVSGYVFSGRLLQPVRRITEDVAEISAQNLTRRLKTGDAKDEWYDLSTTLNDLLNRLQESFDLQRRFISNASHELSTPLTSISSQLEVALQRPREAEEYRKVMGSIYQDVQHMAKLTQALLEFAKASGNPGGLEINLIRIDEVILGLPADVAKSGPNFTVNIEFSDLPEEEENLLVFGNETLLFSALKNIVVNACKYSPNHGAQVRLQVQGDAIVIDVRDNGIGIPPEELDNIFQPFYRVGENRSAGGFGLGLSLAKRIIGLHKGHIHVESQKNMGTLFRITIPAARSLKQGEW